MIKSIASFCCLFFTGFSLLFASPMPGPMNGPPPRKDKLDSTSPYAKMKLQRAERILSTLVFDPQSYHLILSSRSAFGGEAVPPYVFSDKPSIIIYQGALSPNRSDEEIAFMMAHELGHLNLFHMEKFGQQMEKIFTGPPAGISGTTFAIFHQKFQEREADMFGLYLYKQAGYSLTFFPHTLKQLTFNPNLHFGSNKILGQEPTSLSMKDSHFSMKERFELLVIESQKAI
jgi:hypothetical protein